MFVESVRIWIRSTDSVSLHGLASELAVVSDRSDVEGMLLGSEVDRSSTLEASSGIMLYVSYCGVMSRLTYPKDNCVLDCHTIIDRREQV
jgi:hypothetical protein